MNNKYVLLTEREVGMLISGVIDRLDWIHNDIVTCPEPEDYVAELEHLMHLQTQYTELLERLVRIRSQE